MNTDIALRVFYKGGGASGNTEIQSKINNLKNNMPFLTRYLAYKHLQKSNKEQHMNFIKLYNSMVVDQMLSN